MHKLSIIRCIQALSLLEETSYKNALTIIKMTCHSQMMLKLYVAVMCNRFVLIIACDQIIISPDIIAIEIFFT